MGNRNPPSTGNKRVVHDASVPFLEIILDADPFRVREALNKVISKITPMVVFKERIADLELVLAEVINNIVEHAYSVDKYGDIELRIWVKEQEVRCVLMDAGNPIPNCLDYSVDQPEIGTDITALPEGGFGRFIVQSLTKNLQYKRASGKNLVSFDMELADA